MSTLAAALKPRKSPVQARSTATIDALHIAAVQVLTREGLSGCTTTRVAARAGISVGNTVGGFIASWCVQSFGWPAIFVVGGILPLLLAPPLIRLMPESQVLLQARERQAAPSPVASPTGRAPDPPRARSMRARGTQAWTTPEIAKPSTSAHQTCHAIRNALLRPSPIV